MRFGVISFLNMLPLSYGLESIAPSWRTIPDAPSHLLERLRAGECDLAMVPAFDYIRNKEMLHLIPGTCIASKGPVESVLLLSEHPLEQITDVEMDANSHTSNVLGRILVTKYLGLKHVGFHQESQLPKTSRSARIRIGDRALKVRHKYPHSLDLAEAWNAWQGLPFVFAVWVALKDGPWEELADILCGLRDDNLRNLHALLSREPGLIPQGLDMSYARHYLSDCLHYHLGGEEMRGLRQFEGMIA